MGARKLDIGDIYML